MDSYEPHEPIEASPRELTFTAHVETLGLRTITEANTEDLSLGVKMTPQDKILLFVTNSDTTVILESTPTDISQEGGDFKFSADLPEGFSIDQPVNIVGYNGLRDSKHRTTQEYQYFIIKDGEVYMDAAPIIGNSISKFRAPIYFSMRDVVLMGSKVSDLKVTFNHLGSYEVLHIKNDTGEDRAANKTEVRLSDADYAFVATTSWAESSAYVGSDVHTPFVNLATGEVRVAKGSYRDVSQGPPIASGETGTFVNWFLPKPGATFGPTVLYYSNKQNWRTYSSEAALPSHDEPILTGHAYHAYGTITQSGILLTNREGREMEYEIPHFTFTTDIPVGQSISLYTYVSYSERDRAFVDLNGNGLKDPGEEIDSPFGYYTKKVQQPEISIYGPIEAIKIPGQKVTSVRMVGMSKLAQLELHKNLLDEKALNQMMQDLPDIHHIKQDVTTPKTLTISDNPGAETSNIKLAYDKDWSVDIPIILKDQIYTELWMAGSQGKMFINVDAAPEDRANVWIDLNSNGDKDPGEEITNFGMGASHMNSFVFSSGTVILYGKVTTLVAPGSSIFALIDSTNPELKFLDLSGNRIIALALPVASKLEYLDVSGNQFMVKQIPFSTSYYPSLKVLNISNSGIYEIKGGLRSNPELRYLGANGNEIESIDLSKNTNLETLMLSENSLTKLDVSPLKHLTYLELISNNLSRESLTKIYRDLPVITGSVPGSLFIGNNVGAQSSDISIAQQRNWKVDIERLKGEVDISRPKFTGEEW